MKRYAEEISKISINALEEEWKEVVSKMDKDELKTKILYAIKDLIHNVNLYEIESEKIKHNTSSGITVLQQKLDLKRDMIYTKFFRLQNLINAYEEQKIIITYVHKDSDGKREIRLYDNTADHLMTTQGSTWRGSYQKLSYVMSEHYKTLQNALPEETNRDLQETALEVEARYNYKQRKIVYWHLPGRKMAGYKFNNVGPINEAFVNFYINTPPDQNYFNKDTEHNVATYIMHKRFGAIAADNMNGFLVGDVEKNGIQYAVKGDYASPQNFKKVINSLKHLELNATHQDLQAALLQFKLDAAKGVHSLIQESTEKELQKIERSLKRKSKK